MIFFDCETCGLHGMPVLIQYAEDDGPVELYSPWSEPIFATLQLIERFCEQPVCGFNLAFDWFMICKLYTTLNLYVERGGDDTELPMNIIDELAVLESEARDGPCVKPVSAIDLMLHARKGPYQSTMARSDIRIKRVPTVLANKLAEELERRVPLPSIYFAKRSDKNAAQWSVREAKNRDGEVIPELSDVVLSFNSSTALKFLAIDALKIDPDKVKFFDLVSVEEEFYPKEYGYAPFALAVGKPGNWNWAWPEVIMRHINHWRFHRIAREYAADDVIYTRGLYYHFNKPAHGDNDSVLACMIAACRWRGYAVDIPGLQKLRDETLRRITVDGVKIPTSPIPARKWIEQCLDPTEMLGVAMDDFRTSTKKSVLESVSKFTIDCPDCKAHLDTVCPTCNGTGAAVHPAAIRAKQVLQARQAAYEANLYDKFLLAGRFHASYAVIGALSSRMGGGGTAKGIEQGGKAGGDGMNPQGIKKDKTVRSKFPLAFLGDDLGGGDFDGFEVTLAEAVYSDPALRDQLLTCEECDGRLQWVPYALLASEFFSKHGDERTNGRFEGKEGTHLAEGVGPSSVFKNNFFCTSCGSTKGKKIHAIFGINVFPTHTYETLKATDGTAQDLYTDSKRAVFLMLYGGTFEGMAQRLNVPPEIAKAAVEKFHRQFPGVKRAQIGVERRLKTLDQSGGLGTKITWSEPADYIESFLGFRRYFTLENKIAKALYDLSRSLPKDWQGHGMPVIRRDRQQTASGAIMSALYGCAFGLQASNVRAGINHEIQSPGADITKTLQCRIWTLQPSGIHPFLVQPMNVHDEVQCPHKPSVKEKLAAIVLETVESFRSKVPLIRMKWKPTCGTWADK